MARIKPFRGILYNRSKVDIAKVVAPPYDVISKKMQSRLYRRDRHNIIRLILGKQEKSDTPRNNKYTRANRFLNSWLKSKILIKDPKPALYIYTQEYPHRGKKKTRFGFIALMKLEDPAKSGVLPHEYTLDRPKEDRLNLIAKTKANLSPIFSLFYDRENRVNRILKSFIKSRKPLFKIKLESVVHCLWRMDDRAGIDRIVHCLRDKKVFIADGHHRYEVALAYRNMMRKRKKAFKSSMDYVMMYFSNLSEKDNLTILPTHRVVRNISRFDIASFRKTLQKYFYMRRLDNFGRFFEYLEKNRRKKGCFGLYEGRNKFYFLALKEKTSKLDVAVLHELIINKILAVKNPETSIKYVRDEHGAKALVDKGDYQVAFLLRPTDIMEMKALAEKGEMMPQKSTYFYPKLLTGLVINRF